MIDAAQRLTATRRTVVRRRDGPDEVHALTVVLDLPASVEDVWAACTEPERIAAWLLPVRGDLRAGGHFDLEGHASGVVERCVPPRELAFTWELDENDGVVVLALRPAAGATGTRLTLEHRVEVDDPVWALYGPGATGVGWELTLLGLDLHLRTAAGAAPVDAASWAAGEDGVAFVSAAAEAWGAADAAAGTDVRAARAAAARTTEAYAGPTGSEG